MHASRQRVRETVTEPLCSFPNIDLYITYTAIRYAHTSTFTTASTMRYSDIELLVFTLPVMHG
jgi:hypothetical protein